MKKEFITYEQALELKQLRFDEACLCRYCVVTKWEEPTGEILLQDADCNLSERNLVKAPLYQQAFRWFRDNYNFHHYIEPINMDGKVRYEYCVVDSSDDDKEFSQDIAYDYEDAQIECLNLLINLIKK